MLGKLAGAMGQGSAAWAGSAHVFCSGNVLGCFFSVNRVAFVSIGNYSEAPVTAVAVKVGHAGIARLSHSRQTDRLFGVPTERASPYCQWCLHSAAFFVL
jgi:hypothetical protein